MDKKKDLVHYLKSRSLKSSFRRKSDLLQYLHEIKWGLNFPWRKEQLDIINCFFSLRKNEIIGLQGLFGCGKTTLLLGMVNIGLWKDVFQISEICFCAFNVCIKNEIKKKIKGWGCKDKINVRTFDSLIYEFCKYYEYTNLKHPDYQDKRMFIYHMCENKKNTNKYFKYDHIKYLFVDECQDLEKQSFLVFKTFFPNACIIFVGDIFQSVQKEPRESLMWYLSQNIRDSIHYFYMKITPRVPTNILNQIQYALIKNYPEYQTQIMEWQSSSVIQNTNIEWKIFKTYNDLYEQMFHFLETYPLEKSMILTFSSCITVRGALGDLARVRRILQSKGIKVNDNYKNMKTDCLFLSTVNSSKGLERDYVFVMSTFPLEKAFINFSDDLTTNLITVALSRTKEKMIICVPSLSDKFSKSFCAYQNCPKPLLISSDNIKFSEETLNKFLYLEHSTTELLRQNIIQYNTRLYFKSFIKKTIYTDVSSTISTLPSRILKSEEERCFVGICIEILINSTWTNRFPSIPSLDDIIDNPYYVHCISKIQSLKKKYQYEKKKNKNCLSNSKSFFDTIFIYSELFIAIHHKIFFYFNVEQKNDLFFYWMNIQNDIFKFKPSSSYSFEIQKNVKMPLITGIMDGLLSSEQKQIYEIKASVANDWKDTAFIQAFIYAISIGQSWFHIQLLNVFKNSSIHYILFIDNINHIRLKLLYDVFVWNLNSYLAKTYIPHSFSDEILFFNFEIDDLNSKISEIVVIRLFSPTRMYIHFHSFDFNKNDWDSFLLNYVDKKFILCNTISDCPYIKYPEKYSISPFKIPFESLCQPPQNMMKLPFQNIVLQTLVHIIYYNNNS